MTEIGRLLVVTGVALAVLGLILWAGFGNWIGRLPGDVRIERGSGVFYFPIVTCLVISIVFSLLVAIFRR